MPCTVRLQQCANEILATFQSHGSTDTMWFYQFGSNILGTLHLHAEEVAGGWCVSFIFVGTTPEGPMQRRMCPDFYCGGVKPCVALFEGKGVDGHIAVPDGVVDFHHYLGEEEERLQAPVDGPPLFTPRLPPPPGFAEDDVERAMSVFQESSDSSIRERVARKARKLVRKKP